MLNNRAGTRYIYTQRDIRVPQSARMRTKAVMMDLSVFLININYYRFISVIQVSRILCHSDIQNYALIIIDLL